MIALLLALSALPSSQTIEILADRDTTLIENPNGDVANGSGPIFQVGRTSQGQNGTRRGLLRFDVAGALPEGAIIEDARLTLHMSQTNGGPATVELHRVREDWGEGASSAGGGSGAPAQPGDATWLHTFHDGSFWTTAGGDFFARASARSVVDGVGFYSWRSRRVIREVRRWRDVPARNFGWILLGDETQPTTSKRFDSRENSNADRVPKLTVTYRLPGAAGLTGGTPPRFRRVPAQR